MEMVVMEKKGPWRPKQNMHEDFYINQKKARWHPVVLSVGCLSFSHAGSWVEPPGLHVVQNI